MVAGLLGQAGSAIGTSVSMPKTVKVNVGFGGTVMKPTVKTGTKAGEAGANIKDQAVTAVKDKANEEAQKILADAQAQVAKLKADAQAASDKLKTEAYAAADKQVEEVKNPLGKIAAKKAAELAKKEADKIRGDKPISPFYRMTRNEFKSTLGRDFDESGGANTDNMRALLNHQNNLGQKLHDIERDWHDDQSERIMTDLMPKNPTLGNMMSWYVASHKAVRKNDRDNPTYIHPETSLDVPPPLSPRERARIPLDAAGKPIDPNDPRGRRLPTSPIDTKRKTRDPFTGEEEWKMFDINLENSALHVLIQQI
jgi:site-specific DNA-cytosine methylase